MSKWTQKQLIDEVLQDYWSSSENETDKAKVIGWINEVQDMLVQEIRIPHFRIQLKKLLPTEQETINLSPEIPGAATAVLSAGGSLVEDSVYKVITTFLIYDDDGKRYIESEAGTESSELTATAVNATIDLTNIPVYSGDTSVNPLTIYRRVYLAIKADGESEFADPILVQTIQDNSTTTLSISSEPSSTVTPPSDTEIDELSSEQMTWATGSGYLRREDRSSVRRYSPSTTNTTSDTPYVFDYEGNDSIFLWPPLSSESSTAQRTLIYWVYRRPHEVFYESSRKVDLPISFKRALKAGVKWLGYDHRDREGYRSREDIFEKEKAKLIRKYNRSKGRPTTVRDVNGDEYGYMVD